MEASEGLDRGCAAGEQAGVEDGSPRLLPPGSPAVVIRHTMSSAHLVDSNEPSAGH